MARVYNFIKLVHRHFVRYFLYILFGRILLVLEETLLVVNVLNDFCSLLQGVFVVFLLVLIENSTIRVGSAQLLGVLGGSYLESSRRLGICGLFVCDYDWHFDIDWGNLVACDFHQARRNLLFGLN